MWIDELELTGSEARAAAALRAALRQLPEPVVIDPAWFEPRPAARRGWRLPAFGLSLAAAIVLAVVALAWSGVGQPAASASPSGSPSPSIPGTPGHFDNGTFSFDYPTTWRTLSGEFQEGPSFQTVAVIGTGAWTTGCSFGPGGGGCYGDHVDASGGRVVVKLYERVGGPVVPCATVTPNAVVGSNAVFKTVQGRVVTWEIRRPGTVFFATNNIFVMTWTDSAGAASQAEALVASFRWASNVDPGACFPLETSSPVR